MTKYRLYTAQVPKQRAYTNKEIANLNKQSFGTLRSRERIEWYFVFQVLTPP